MQHLANHWYEYLVAAGAAMSGWSWLSYAAQTFPVPKNPYGRWFLGVVQKALANQNKVDEIKAADK
jgi:hypothetical protein